MEAHAAILKAWFLAGPPLPEITVGPIVQGDVAVNDPPPIGRKDFMSAILSAWQDPKPIPLWGGVLVNNTVVLDNPPFGIDLQQRAAVVASWTVADVPHRRAATATGGDDLTGQSPVRHHRRRLLSVILRWWSCCRCPRFRGRRRWLRSSSSGTTRPSASTPGPDATGDSLKGSAAAHAAASSARANDSGIAAASSTTHVIRRRYRNSSASAASVDPRMTRRRF